MVSMVMTLLPPTGLPPLLLLPGLLLLLLLLAMQGRPLSKVEPGGGGGCRPGYEKN